MLFTEALPAPCVIPVTTNGAAVFTRLSAPAPVFVPLNVPTVFAPPSV